MPIFLKLIFKFRDYVARRLDLSPTYVLDNKVIFTLSKLPKLDLENIYMNLDKHSKIRNFVPELHKLIELKLIRNEKKIAEGNAVKLLEQNYLQSVKEKFNQAKLNATQTIKKMKDAEIKKNEENNFKNLAECSSISIASKENSDSTRNILYLNDIKIKGEEIQFGVKIKSKLYSFYEFTNK
jgi:ribonuclease D